MRDANAVVYLVPGVGMFTFAADKATARIAAEFYLNAINVMRGASAVSTYRGLPEQEAFDIEYWDLEEAKLQRMPKPRAFAGRVALITGGAGGIGSRPRSDCWMTAPAWWCATSMRRRSKTLRSACARSTARTTLRATGWM